MQSRVSHLHLVLDDTSVLREVLAGYPGRPATPILDEEKIPLKDVEGFLSAAINLGEVGHLRHTDGILYRINSYTTAKDRVILAVPTYRPPDNWAELRGSEPIVVVADAIRRRGGLVLVLGDMNAGKTTVAATYLAESLRLCGGTAFVWQDPIEIDLDGWHGDGRCHQIEIGADGYAKAAMDALRSRAQYLFFGEPRTPDACLAVMKAGLSGPQTIATAHGDTLINGLLKFAANAHILDSQSYNLLAACLTAVIHLSLKDVGTGPVLTVESLVVQSSALSDPSRVAIRTQNVEGLVSQIRMQRNQMVRSAPEHSRSIGGLR